MTQQIEFKGTVGGVTYTDRRAFEKAARDLGYRLGTSGRTGDWRVGTAVGIRYSDGSTVLGQVWAKGAEKGTIWLALDNGKFLLAYTRTGDVYAASARSGALSSSCVGKVAA